MNDGGICGAARPIAAAIFAKIAATAGRVGGPAWGDQHRTPVVKAPAIR